MNLSVLRLLMLAAVLLTTPSIRAEITVTLATVEVEDGDTLIVELDGRTERVQLMGIDAPEDKGNAKLQRDLERTGLEAEALLLIGKAATEHLQALVDRGGPFALTYDPTRRDRYGRLLAEVSGAGAGSLNIAMLEDGYAVVLLLDDAQAAADDPRRALQREAVATRRGLWGDHRETALAWRGKNLSR